MHEWHEMGNVCGKTILKFLLPCIGETQAPYENQAEWRGWGQRKYAGGEQLLT